MNTLSVVTTIPVAALNISSVFICATPKDTASPPMRYLATGFTIPGVPNAVIVWAIIGAIAASERGHLCSEPPRGQDIALVLG